MSEGHQLLASHPASDDIELDIRDSAAETAPLSSVPDTPSAQPTASPVIHLTVRTLTGQSFNIEVNDTPNVTVDDVKQALYRAQDIPVSFQRLIFAGRELRDGQLLSTYNIKDGNVLHVVLKQVQAQPAPPGPANVNVNYGPNGAPAPADPAAMLQNYNGFVLQMPAPGASDTDPWRIRQAFQLSKIVKLFAVIDSIFLIIWAFGFPPFAIGVLLAMCGYYGAQTFKAPYVMAYIVFIALSIGVRTYMTMMANSVGLTLLLTLGIFVEVYILSLVWRFFKLVRQLTPAERHELLMMQQGGLIG